jgi:hypothetical protein
MELLGRRKRLWIGGLSRLGAKNTHSMSKPRLIQCRTSPYLERSYRVAGLGSFVEADARVHEEDA